MPDRGDADAPPGGPDSLHSLTEDDDGPSLRRGARGPAGAWFAAAAVVIVATAAAVRLIGLASQPGGLYVDEAAEGWDAYRLLHEPGFHPLWFTDDAGREVPFGYVVALGELIFGASPVVLRGVAGVIGVLGVIAVMAALRRFGPVAALAGGAWTAGSLWLVAVSRDGMRNVTVPVVGALALLALFRLADRPTRGRALAAGAALALGLWTYQPLKLLPLLAVVWLIWLRHANRPVHDAIRARAWWLAGGFAAVAAPMAGVAIAYATSYFGRGAAVSVFAPGAAGEGFLTHVGRTLGMFFVSGDPNQRHNVAGLPMLGIPLSAVAVLGGIHAWRCRAHPDHALLLIGIPVFMFPPLIAVEGGSPHFLRSLGLAPFVAGLIGLGCLEAIELGGRAGRRRGAHRRTPRAGRLLAGLACGALIVGVGAAGATAYFSRPVADRYGPYGFALVALAEAAHGPATTVLADGDDASVVLFIDHDDQPAIAPTGQRLDLPAGHTVAALRRQDLDRALGRGAAGRATAIAWDWRGQPVAWAVST